MEKSGISKNPDYPEYTVLVLIFCIFYSWKVRYFNMCIIFEQLNPPSFRTVLLKEY